MEKALLSLFKPSLALENARHGYTPLFTASHWLSISVNDHKSFCLNLYRSVFELHTIGVRASYWSDLLLEVFNFYNLWQIKCACRFRISTKVVFYSAGGIQRGMTQKCETLLTFACYTLLVLISKGFLKPDVLYWSSPSRRDVAAENRKRFCYLSTQSFNLD